MGDKTSSAETISKIGKRLQAIEISQEYIDEVLDHGETAKRENRTVFEIAWEVANKGQNFICKAFSKSIIDTYR